MGTTFCYETKAINVFNLQNCIYLHLFASFECVESVKKRTHKLCSSIKGLQIVNVEKTTINYVPHKNTIATLRQHIIKTLLMISLEYEHS